MGAGNLSSGPPECAVSTPPVQASSPACGFMLDVLYFSLCFSDGVWCFGKLWQLRGIGALQAPMKGRLAPSPGWLFSRSPSMIFMKSGLRVGASFPQGVHLSLRLSWSPSKLLFSVVSILMDNLEGLGVPLLPLSFTWFITRVGKILFPPHRCHVAQLFVTFPPSGNLGTLPLLHSLWTQIPSFRNPKPCV